ncbi:MAG: 16S rRNA (uracil(1498)-N(3))-methyltransferase [Phycisphaerae bacterium]|nr:16S rRNA (uracil(1498)-N(3))-methyltransferase [Phycisphaerae bacterium]
MSKARFFSAELEGQVIELGGAEAHHLLNVRRVRIGEEVELFDGKGQKVRGRLESVAKKVTRIEVLEKYTQVSRGIEIVVACALAKGSRWGWLLEKCVELGAGKIWPVIFERSVVKGAGSTEQLSKWNRRCIEAAKQCGQAYLPEIAQPRGLKEILEGTKGNWLGLVGAVNASAEPILRVLEKADRARGLVLLVGPEGGLSAQEQRLAEERGYEPVFLGENTLRVETATIGFLAAVRAWIESQIKNQKSNSKITYQNSKSEECSA